MNYENWFLISLRDLGKDDEQKTSVNGHSQEDKQADQQNGHASHEEVKVCCTAVKSNRLAHVSVAFSPTSPERVKARASLK